MRRYDRFGLGWLMVIRPRLFTLTIVSTALGLPVLTLQKKPNGKVSLSR